MSEITSLTYQEVPNNKLQAKMLTNISPTDYWLTGVFLLTTATTAVWLYKAYDNSGPAALAVLAILFVYAVLMLRLSISYGRMYNELFYGSIVAFKQAIFRGVWWLAEDDSPWFIRWLRDRNGKRPVFPLGFTVIEATVDKELKRMALIRELDQPYDHAYIALRGGAFATHGPNMQSRLVGLLTEIVNRTVAQADLKLGITYLGLSGPANETDITGFFGGNINPLIIYPERFQTDEATKRWAAKAAVGVGEIRPALRAFGAARRINLIQIVIKRDRKQWRSAQKGKYSNEQLYDLPIIELSTSLAESLRSQTVFQFDEVEVLGLADLAEIVRCSWDVTHIQEYYEARRIGAVPRTDEEINAFVDEYGTKDLLKYLRCWPQERKEIGRYGKWYWLRLDDTYYTALRMSKLPKRFRPDQALALSHIPLKDAWLRSAIAGQSISGETETRNLIVQTSAAVNLNRALFSGHVVEDPRRRRRQRDLENQTEQVSAHSIAQDFNNVYVIAAKTPRDAIKMRAYYKAQLLGANFTTVEVNDPTHIEDAIISGIFGINRL